MKEISVQEFKDVLGTHTKETAYINVCTPIEYTEEHIDGVQNIPLDALSSNINTLSKYKTIYVHCKTGNRGKQAAELLQSSGIASEIIHVSGGIQAWKDAGLSTIMTRGRLPLMRQTLLAAGMLVTFSILGTLFVHEYFIGLALFIGCGLMFAGVTGWCGMSLFLAKMPWNK